MNILHIANIDLSVDGGGMNLVIPELARLQYEARNDDSISLLALNNNRAPADKYNFDIFYWDELNKLSFSRFDLIVFHSVYNLKFYNLYRKCLKYNIPYIIVSHGGLAKITMGKSALKRDFIKFASLILLYIRPHLFALQAIVSMNILFSQIKNPYTCPTLFSRIRKLH